MGVTSEASPDGKMLTIRIEGRFDFSMHQAFRNAYERIKEKPEVFTIDLHKATYLDSSALGMLLLLRDHAGGEQAQVTIAKPNSDVNKILAISNFNKLFKIT